MIVDDSAVIRGLMTTWLGSDPAIKIVGTAGNGEMALASMLRYDPEIVILDIEMPVMDGLTALPQFFKIDPDVKVLMASTLTKRNAEVSMKALSMGASDYVSKPESNREVAASMTFQEDVISKVINIVASARLRNGGTLFEGASSLVKKDYLPVGKTSQPISMRSFTNTRPSVLAIGSSTGGPQALLKVLSDLGPVDVPIVITQHMPATFTNILAKHLSASAGLDCKEAEDGDILEPGKAYLAPGDNHMTIVEKGGRRVVVLNQDPPENYCRPSVEPMMRSLVKAYGGDILGVILTGMGHDGLAACKMLVEAGGNLIAQDEKTSVVWGMPGSVVNAGLCGGVYPLEEIGGEVKQKLMGPAR